MKILRKKIDEIIKDELKIINKKIKGTNFLEVMKLGIIEKLNTLDPILSLNSLENIENISEFNEEAKIIYSKIFISKSQLSYVGKELNLDSLFVCINENMFVGVEDIKTKKIFNTKLIKGTGITLPKKTKYNINFSENSVILEISIKEIEINIENEIQNTI